MRLTQLNRRWRELLILLVLAVLTTPFFWLTDLDLRAAALFYRPDADHSPWPLQQGWLWQILYRYAFGFAYTVAIGALLIVALGFWIPVIKPLRKQAAYVLLVIALGPGLVVNLIFKDHWGRPRPVHMSEFGGVHHYVPPVKMGDTREKSFPCGHCSVGFAFFALYFLARKRKSLFFGLTIVMGLTLGLARMTAGGHFLSDILWSGYVMFFVAWLAYYGWYEHEPVINREQRY